MSDLGYERNQLVQSFPKSPFEKTAGAARMRILPDSLGLAKTPLDVH